MRQQRSHAASVWITHIVTRGLPGEFTDPGSATVRATNRVHSHIQYSTLSAILMVSRLLSSFQPGFIDETTEVMLCQQAFLQGRRKLVTIGATYTLNKPGKGQVGQ